MPMEFSHEESVEAVREYFDRLGEGEWDRLEADAAARVSHQIHLTFMGRFIQDGMRVLEIGAGPGRFTTALVALGARVLVTDVSPVQIELNKSRVAEAGVEDGIEGWEIVDVTNTSHFESASFDAVLAFGGPISYAFDKAQEAFEGLLRVTTPGGPVVASVMSTLGAYRHFLPAVVQIGRDFGEDANERIMETGDLRETQPPGAGLHTCRMFRSEEITEMVHHAGASLLGISASNWASLDHQELMEELSRDQAHWESYVAREIWASAQPGAVDGGTHILFAASRG